MLSGHNARTGMSATVAALVVSVLFTASPAFADPGKAKPPPKPGATAPIEEKGSSVGDIEFAKTYQSAVALLYARNWQGTDRMLCTATPIERDGNVYRFVTAAHCVSEDNDTHDHVRVQKGFTWYLSFDDDPSKEVKYRAKIVAVGLQSRGDDFVVLEATIADRTVPVIAFATNPARVLEPVINVAAPTGLGKQVFTGHVSSDKLDRPAQEGDINWEGAIMLQMGSSGGSSGSAIVSLEQKGIIAFLVGHIGGGDSINITALPAARFQKFWEKSKAGKYKWWKPADKDDDGEDDGCLCRKSDPSDCWCPKSDLPKTKPAPRGKAKKQSTDAAAPELICPGYFEKAPAKPAPKLDARKLPLDPDDAPLTRERH